MIITQMPDTVVYALTMVEMKFLDHFQFEFWHINIYDHWYQNHTWTFWCIWRLKTKFLRFLVEDKYDAYSVRNIGVLPILMFSVIFSWNSTPFWPKTLFSISKTGRVILFSLYLCKQQPQHIFFACETVSWLLKITFSKMFNFISRWNSCGG